jgi:hypothetical protein
MTDDRSAIRGTVSGRVGGVALDGDATILLVGNGVRLDGPAADLTLHVSAIDGAVYHDSRLTLFLGGDDVVTVGGSARLAVIARELAGAVCALPELTLPLRGLGSRRGRPGSEHDRFFAPLLAARKKCERAADAQARIRAFDAAALGAAVTDAIGAVAKARYPSSAPDRRALEAEMLELAEPLAAALGRLGFTSKRAISEVGGERGFVVWRDWCAAVGEVFERADAAWMAFGPVLAAAPPAARRPLWRRMLRIGVVLAATVFPPSAGSQHVVVRVPGVAPESLLVRDFDLVAVGLDGPIVVADSVALARLASFGWSAILLETPLANAARRARLYGGIPTTVYRSFDDPVRGIRFFLDSIAAANPRVRVDSIGASVEGRPILAAKVGPADDSPGRPNAIFLATYHAREWAATEMALRLMKHLARPPGTDRRVDSLVANRDIWIVPVVNPDGYEHTFTTNRLWRKNRRPGATAGTFGVDLNRNHSEHWAFDDVGSSPSQTSETYRGTAAASEPETQAIEGFHALHPPVVSVSYHTFTGLVLYPPGFRFGVLAGDRSIFQALAGTPDRPAVIDNLPGSPLAHYHPGPSWNLYTTNGEYNDWAYTRHGTISFTPELTSGYEDGVFYGFEFPDDEQRLEIVFQDNLPFALDVLESARDPLRYAGRLGLAPERVVLESVSPTVRVRVRESELSGTRVTAGVSLALTLDAEGEGKYMRRLVGTPPSRPQRVTVATGFVAAEYSVRAIEGAETSDAGWTANGFTRTSGGVAGASQWMALEGGTLLSPPVTVDAQTDTVSVLFWTRYFGSAFSLDQRGEIRVSFDGGLTWIPAGAVAGVASRFYPERVKIGGVRGRTVRIEFAVGDMDWFLDDIAIVAHGPFRVTNVATLPLAPSANPVRGDRVFFQWPFADLSGELVIMDFAGRQVWQSAVAAGTSTVAWDVSASAPRNGVYVAVARAGSRIVRQQLYILR